MSARQDIFERIAQAIGPARPPAEIAAEAAALLADPEAVRPPTPRGDLGTRFMDAVTRLPPGASVEQIDDMSALPAAVARRLAAMGLEPALKIQPTPDFQALDFQAVGIGLRDAVDDRTSLSLAEAAIAETASLVIRSGPHMPILDAFLPLHHLVAVRRRDILPYLDDFLDHADLVRSRNVVIVTGPSGTTDIEGSLVIGVHGPATLHIFVVDEG
ncbi:L-lactate dehydrogenase complex protein LldG [Aureimonas altamirensis DSM 21988]|uniref:L-lactate dehydrogenase complex protein LldG n=1 Tax=Aureimonas altamirensis DSM 21988 TaxID=1121026 RepID=A0ABY1INY0_9HYPH|nr:LUD domain-containing protein [Aureimonas altamirensis]SHJ71646.1 L-lactate dehydrogenase complex protein LldG [Aureimonas altamirensis DSM 21988]